MEITTSPKKLRICVLGGTGFVGGHLVARLARDGHSIKVLTRHRERHRALLVLPTVQVGEADIHDPATLEREFAGYDAVVNLVGILNERGRDGQGFARAHVELPRKVATACRRERVGRLLHMSALGADAAYGSSVYQRTKGEGENIAHAAIGVAVTSFRPSVIYGPGDSFFNRFAALLRRTPWLFPLACPNARFAPVYVEDVAEAYARALNNLHTHGQRYDLCGPHSYTLKQLVEYTARVLHLRRRVIGLSDRLSRMQANIFEYLPGKPFSHDNYLSMRRDNVCDGPFPPLFRVTPRAIESVVPYYLNGKDLRARLDETRVNHRPPDERQR